MSDDFTFAGKALNDSLDFPAIMEFLKNYEPTPVVVLFVMSPRDTQYIIDNWKDYKKHENPDPPLFPNFHPMGFVPVWTSPRIEDGKPRHYYSWIEAYEELKFVLEGADLELLEMKAGIEKEIKK